MVLNASYMLSNGVRIPKLGLGTWFINDKQAPETVQSALTVGYRHFDTAQAYGNEAGVGMGIINSNVSREEIFVTSKVAAELKSYDAVINSVDQSLEKMGLDYLDMMIIHSPQPWQEWRSGNRYFEENKEVWRALEAAYKAGKLQAIGVSNFMIDDLDHLMEDCKITPMVNQILVHIGNTPIELIEFCQQQNILVEAYSPIAHGEVLQNEKIRIMADKYGVSVAQLCIRYVIELGMAALPKTANILHMEENSKIDFSLTETDMNQLKSLSLMNDYGEFSHFPVFSRK